jgi:hypothetical protein
LASARLPSCILRHIGHPSRFDMPQDINATNCAPTTNMRQFNHLPVFGL